jgi:hypothetical protein
MSGEFRPEQQHTIDSTNDADLARRFGLTDFNRETGLYTAPKTPDAGQRDGADVQEQRREAAKAEGDEQQRAEDEKLKAAGLGGPGDDVTGSDERKPGAPTKATKAAAAKASQSKTDDKTDDDKK